MMLLSSCGTAPAAKSVYQVIYKKGVQIETISVVASNSVKCICFSDQVYKSKMSIYSIAVYLEP